MKIIDNVKKKKKKSAGKWTIWSRLALKRM